MEKKLPLRKRLPMGARIPLQLLSFLLSLVLGISLLASALTLDLQQMTSAGTLRAIVETVMAPSRAPHGHSLTALAAPVQQDGTANITLPLIYDENGTPIAVRGPEDLELPLPEGVFFATGGEGRYEAGKDPATGDTLYVQPIFTPEMDFVLGFVLQDGSSWVIFENDDILNELPLPDDLTDIDALTQWAMELIRRLLGEDVQVNQESIKGFLIESTVMDFVANSAGQLAMGTLAGEEVKIFTPQAVEQLLSENKSLIESSFGVTLDAQQIQQIVDRADEIIVQNRLNETLQEKTHAIMNDAKYSILGFTLAEIVDATVTAAGTTAVLTALGISLLLMLLLVAANFYNLPAGLTWASLPCIFTGLLLSIPTALLQSMDLAMLLPGDAAKFGNIAGTLIQRTAAVHYGLLILGVVLLAVSILWRILRASHEKKLALA